jgi:CHAD domain-containing protein
MSFHLDVYETIPNGVKRIALEQIDKAILHLEHFRETSSSPGNEPIGHARARFKRVRGLLRLVRCEIGPKTYRRENGCLRGAGRKLSVLRDSLVVFKTLDQLIGQTRDRDATSAAVEFRRALTSANAIHLAAEEQVILKVDKAVRGARGRLADWPVHRDGFGAFKGGLARVYADARTAFAGAFQDPTVTHFHDLRKQVGYLRSQLLILRLIEPEALRQLSGDLKELEGYLSEDHDLAVLGRWFRAVMDKAGAVEPMFALIRQRRAELECKAKPLGARLLAEDPGPFVARLEDYFNQWRGNSEAGFQPATQSVIAEGSWPA